MPATYSLNPKRDVIGYACHSKPRPPVSTTYPGHDGYDPPREQRKVIGHRTARVVHLQVLPSVAACQYIPTKPDPRCAGCPHIQGAV